MKGGVTTAGRTLLTEDLAPATETTFDRINAKFGAEDGAAILRRRRRTQSKLAERVWPWKATDRGGRTCNLTCMASSS